jgi:hypothetical protein
MDSRPSTILVIAGLAVLTAACAARSPARPTGSATASLEAVSDFEAATRHCAGLRTLTGELGLSGRAGDERLRGRIIVGLESGGAARLEGVAPFGPAVFILVARQEAATLLLPRDRGVVTGATVSAVLERLTGLALGAGELLRVLSGCPGRDPTGGRRYPGGWQSVTVDGNRTIVMRRQSGAWAVVAADADDWQADYADVLNGFPRTIRLRSRDGRVDLTARVQQLEVNTEIPPAAWEVAIPPDTRSLTLDDLRAVSPLRSP